VAEVPERSRIHGRANQSVPLVERMGEIRDERKYFALFPVPEMQ